MFPGVVVHRVAGMPVRTACHTVISCVFKAHWQDLVMRGAAQQLPQ